MITVPQVPPRLQQRLIDSIQGGKQRQDHVRDVAVHQAQDHRQALPLQPVTGSTDDVEEHQALVHQAVVLKQVDPRQHPHEVADEERRDQRKEQDRLEPAAMAGDEVGHRIPDEETQDYRDGDVDERAEERRLVDAASKERLVEDEPHRGRVPPQRVPHRNGSLEQRIDPAEGHRDDRVEGQDEQQDKPQGRRKGEGRPEPPRIPHAAPRRGAFPAGPPPARWNDFPSLRHPP